MNRIPYAPMERRRKLPVIVATTLRRFDVVNSMIIILVVLVVRPQRIIVAFQNSYSTRLLEQFPSTTNSNHRFLLQPQQLQQQYISTPPRTNKNLYALLQESDQREKKQSQSPPSSSPSSSPSPDASCRHTNGDTQRQVDPTKDEFTLHIGRALDTLRQEYPTLLTQSPDYSLYDVHMCLCVDLPTLPLTALTYNSVSGLSRYKMVWDMTHTTLSLIYNLDQSYMSSIKLCHDRVRGNIVRVQWHAVLFPRWQKQDVATMAVGHPPPPSSKCHHVDGISVYELDWTTGKIIQHRIEQLVYTNNAPPVMVMDDVMLRQAAKVIGGGIPIQIVKNNNYENCNAAEDMNCSFLVEFRTPIHTSFRPTSLFAMEAEQSSSSSKLQPTSTGTAKMSSSSNDIATISSITTTTFAMNNNNNKHDGLGMDENTSLSPPVAVATTSIDSAVAVTKMIDNGAFDAKNKSRQKFGLKPLSMEEFLHIEHQVEQLANTQQEAIKEAKLLASQQQAEKEAAGTGPSIFDKVFGSVMKNLDTCESNFDCVRPQVCCDYVFAKKCCTSGSPILSDSSKTLRYARIPVYGGDNKPFPPQQGYPPTQRYIQ